MGALASIVEACEGVKTKYREQFGMKRWGAFNDMEVF